ncbi:hypothetical protein F5B21DRAFT_509445 [Xylaria acuta]|nr:hypothetical protein F5B21DRAFT_509445 [Xylaria acuta]
MAPPAVSPTCYDPKKALLIMSTIKEQDHNASADAATQSEHSDTTTDYTSYGTKGLYGIFKASVREHPDLGTEVETRLSLSAMESLMDVAVSIALIIFMYYAYVLIAEEYTGHSLRPTPDSSGAMPAQCTCSNGR